MEQGANGERSRLELSHPARQDPQLQARAQPLRLVVPLSIPLLSFLISSTQARQPLSARPRDLSHLFSDSRAAHIHERAALVALNPNSDRIFAHQARAHGTRGTTTAERTSAEGGPPA